MVAAPAAAQVKPRFVIAFDTSGSMADSLSGTGTNGDGVGRAPIAGDNQQRVLNGVYYGCASPRTGAGVDQNGDCFPNDSRMWIAKNAVRQMIGAFGDVEWALSRFQQTQSLNASNTTYRVDIDNGASCTGTQGQCGDGSTNYSINYAGESQSTCQTAGNGKGQMVVGFPRIAGQGFASSDNRSALLRWMDNIEGTFHAPVAADTTAVDLCAHRTLDMSGNPVNNCELRSPPGAFTPLGGIIRDSASYITSVRSSDAASSCRPYSIILITDGAETCNTNPNGAASTALASNVKTYVVGVSISSGDQSSLNAIAMNGGTGAAYFANSETELSAALSEIVNASQLFEVCDGLDNDCDNKIDEDQPPAQPDFGMPVNGQSSSLFCDGEAHRTAAQNTQVRARSDVSDTFPLTTPITTPQVCGRVTDTCQNPGVDDDCDGATDENGTLNACGRCPGAADVCDGVDNDCDGRFDEGTTGQPFGACPQVCTADVPCGSDVGACQTGFYRCVGGVLNTSVCDGQVTGSAEVCDEIDNDCNGIVDDPAVLARACPGWPSGYVQGGTSICQRGTQFCARTSIGELEDANGYRVSAGGQPICPGQVLPDDREICDGLDHDCNGNNFTCTQATCTSSSLAFVGNTCGTGVGICVGQLLCDQNGNPDGGPPVLVCNAPSAGTETCNNTDDDCDGKIDEMAVAGPDLMGMTGGPSNGFCGTVTTDNGACNRGRYVCTNGNWSCAGAIGPSTEICDGIDNDCDNVPDSTDTLTDPRIGQQCGTSIGECRPGLAVCNGTDVVCTPVRGPMPEDCDGKDNDCDYLTDEKLPDNNNDGVKDVIACGTSVGACEPGTLACTVSNTDADGFDYTCAGGTTASPEVCDGEDNDCDGATDECAGAHNTAAYMACNGDPLGLLGGAPVNQGLGAGGGDVCGTNVAPCTPGKTKCVIDVDPSNGVAMEPGFVCVGNTVGSAEICDGMDQDCDTKIDEDIDPDVDERLGERCGTAEVGDCRIDVDMDDVPNDPDDQPCGQCRFGLTSCVAGKVDCIDLITPDEYEACNNTDDDCDGETDECVDPDAAGCMGEVDPASPIGDACGQDDPNACGSGELRCTDGSLECENVPTGGTELCNAMDDDCDTLIDETFHVGDTCGPSAGECQPGIIICDPSGSGDTVCQDPVGPTDEVCDGLDNDCDNAIDEDTNKGTACGSDKGECSKGTLQCVSGRERCVGEDVPTIEVCDCLDNDCDGKTDEESSASPLCGNTAECVMCQCALPCADAAEFGTGCPQGKSPIQNDDGCFCVGTLCQRAECAASTIMDGDQVRCAPDSDRAGECECRNNECTHQCAGVQCEGGLVCDLTTGSCDEPTCLLAQLACDEGQRCSRVDGDLQCVIDECANVTCDADEACRLGDCKKSCGRVMCDSDERCIDGDCVADLCKAVTCMQGKVCDPESGDCVEAGECTRMPCLQGQVCDPVGGECSEDPCSATRCPQDERCDSTTGQCKLRCAADFVYCDGGCVDPQSSREHCGASGVCTGDDAGEACAEGRVCSRGECSDTCADGLVNCGGECVNGQSDDLHCGAKDDCVGNNAGGRCPEQYTCMEGSCRPINPPMTPDDGEDTVAQRVIASGGGGCTCSVPGSTRGGESTRFGLSMALAALGFVLLGRRKRRAVPAHVRALLVALLLAGISSLGAGCKVDTFCINCGDDDDNSMGGSSGVSGFPGGGGTNGGSSGVNGNGNGDSGVAGNGGASGNNGDAGPGGADGGCMTGAPELCNGLDDDCDTEIDEDVDPAAGGFDITSDPLHCGSCGNACSLPHAFNRCEDSECKIDRSQGDDGCDVGYFDLDEEESNGCEYRCNKTNDLDTCDQVDNDCDKEIDEDVDFQNDPLHCGSCARCILRNVEDVACEEGVCVIGDDSTCTERYADIDGLDATGCEYRCPVFPPVPEVCNGRDDDCNGQIDDGALSDDARVGIACGNDTGVCSSGETVCQGGAVLCQGSTGGSVEVCDGLDNDCDGMVDTDHPDIGKPCGTAVPGSECSQGTLQIPSSGCTGGVVADLVCVGGQGPVAEICNGRDDDCDGRADEATGTPAQRPGAGQMCTNTPTGVMIVASDPAGLCAAGITSCVSGSLVCRGEVGPEPVELCDAQDHDCDGNNLNGFVDEGGGIASVGPDPDVGDPCGIDTGACTFGTVKCNLNTAATFCDGGQGPVTETCNAIDDDCDGRIDERPTPTGFLAGENVACTTNANGSVNTSPSASASRGECHTGSTVCSAGTIRCSGEQGPRPELCDSKDWDCDGNPSNGVAVTDPDVGDPCGLPTVGECRRGVTACIASGSNRTIQCTNALPATTNPAALPQPAATNTPETACDGKDNDCDGVADEGNSAAYPGAGASCCDNAFGCCPGNSGTQRCDAGRVHCVYPGGTQFPGGEVCGDGPGGTTSSGLSLSDDDCDGTIDEGYDTSRDVNNCGGCGIQCAFNSGVTTPHAVLVCSSGACTASCVGNFVNLNGDYRDGCEASCTFTGNEICDGQDNDCNGQVDDAPSLPQQVCIPRRVGVCNVPALLTEGPACSDGMLFCNVQAVANAGHIPNYQAVETLCDGLDNDCDGTVDDGFNVGAQCDNGGVGECRATGTIQCTSTSTAACNAPGVGASTPEVCDGKDNNCDGVVDNFASPGVGTVGNFEVVSLPAPINALMMAYEASRPNATSSSAGTLTNKPCSVEGVLPWTNVTWTEASNACCALNANGQCAMNGTGWRLCDAATFADACEGPNVPACTWGYNGAGACNHAFTSTAYQNTCHGAESSQAGLVTCAPGSTGCATTTGSDTFPACYANWTQGPVSDLSGNVQEWTNTKRFGQVVQCRTFTKTGLPQNVPDNGTLNSVINVPAYGNVTRVRILDFVGDHTADDMDDADVFLVSPAGTTLTMFQDRCNGDDDWAMDLQDGATGVGNSSFCNGNTVGGGIDNAWEPVTAFSTLNGEADSGNWTLQVRDDDSGGGNLVLQSWTLEVCSSTLGDTGYRDIRGGAYNDVESGRTCNFDFEVGSTSFRFPTTGFRCCKY